MMRSLRMMLGGSLLALALVVLAWSASPALAQAPVGPSVFYDVTYQGTATFSTNGQNGCDFVAGAAEDNCFSGPFGSSFTEQWKATFPAVALSLSGATASVPAGAQQMTASSETTDTYCSDGGCPAYDCKFSWPDPDPGAPDLILSGQIAGSELTLSVDAPWRPDPANMSWSGGACQAAGPYEQLPDALRGIASFPISQLDTGTITDTVGNLEPGGYQLVRDCTAPAQADNSEVTSCSQSVQWGGTVTLTPDCTSDAARVGGLAQPPCIKKKRKQEAAQSAAEWRVMSKGENEQVSHACKLRMDMNMNKVCLYVKQMGAQFALLADDEQAIADDPPDPRFARVAIPHSAGASSSLRVLRRSLPATHHLVLAYERIAALESTLVTAQNRATGAFQSLSGGNTAAGADVIAQDRAVIRYASAAAGLLSGQPRLATKASAELGRVAAGLHGRGAHRAASAIRGFAAGLVSGRAARADRLAVSVLKGIGRS